MDKNSDQRIETKLLVKEQRLNELMKKSIWGGVGAATLHGTPDQSGGGCGSILIVTNR